MLCPLTDDKLFVVHFCLHWIVSYPSEVYLALEQAAIGLQKKPSVLCTSGEQLFNGTTFAWRT